jgi:hypothetical protein
MICISEFTRAALLVCVIVVLLWAPQKSIVIVEEAQSRPFAAFDWQHVESNVSTVNVDTTQQYNCVQCLGWYQVKNDYKAAAKWFRQAANQGNAEAQYNLGTLYEMGKGVHHNDFLAAYWHRRAAFQGHLSSQLALGGMYLVGRGVPQNNQEAYRWLNVAAS